MAETTEYNLKIVDEQNFDLSDSPEEEHFVVGFDEPDNLDLSFEDVVNNGTNDFNSLYNRPSYDGEKMTNETDIPKVIHYKAGENIEINGDTISSTSSVTVDDKLSTTSVNPVQNKVITTNLATKVDSADLAPVAFSGDYNDLNQEPTDFSDEEWDLLWKNY